MVSNCDRNGHVHIVLKLLVVWYVNADGTVYITLFNFTHWH